MTLMKTVKPQVDFTKKTTADDKFTNKITSAYGSLIFI